MEQQGTTIDMVNGLAEIADYMEDEDKWSNMEKACWSGYTQRGMKEKNGRMVPNCVPVEKSYNEDEEPKKEMKKSIWDGAFLK